jgi:hypothetical protein
MHNACRVEVLDAAQHLIQQERQPTVVEGHLDDFAQIRVHQLHDQIEIFQVSRILLVCESRMQFDDLNTLLNTLVARMCAHIFMIRQAHQRKFAIRSFRMLARLEWTHEFLYGHIRLCE